MGHSLRGMLTTIGLQLEGGEIDTRSRDAASRRWHHHRSRTGPGTRSVIAGGDHATVSLVAAWGRRVTL